MRRTLASWAILLGMVAFVCLPLSALAQRRGGVPFGLNWNRGRPASSALLSMSLTGDCEGTTPSGLTFTRTSTATCTRADGTLVTLAAGQPRLEAQGLLVEWAATNLLLYSADLSNAAWLKSQAAVAAGGVACGLAPDGTDSVWLVTPTAGATDTKVYQSFTGTNGTSYATSLWVWKPASSGASPTVALQFEVKGTDFSPTTTPTRQNFVRTSTGAISNPGLGGFSAWAEADGPLCVWGAQLEAGPVATSYIPTQGTQVTRQMETAIAETGLAGQGTDGVCFSATVRPANGAWLPAGNHGLLTLGVLSSTSIGDGAVESWMGSGKPSVRKFTTGGTEGARFTSAATVSGSGAASLKFCHVGTTLQAWLDGVNTAGTASGTLTNQLLQYGGLSLGASDRAANSYRNARVSNLCVSGPAGGCP